MELNVEDEKIYPQVTPWNLACSYILNSDDNPHRLKILEQIVVESPWMWTLMNLKFIYELVGKKISISELAFDFWFLKVFCFGLTFALSNSPSSNYNSEKISVAFPGDR